MYVRALVAAAVFMGEGDDSFGPNCRQSLREDIHRE
jgi:hypothetical protein